MKFLKKLHKILNDKTFLILLGIVILFGFIWFRFIRERLPQDIPFQLALGSFISICAIIIIYIYVIYRIMNPKAPNQLIKTFNAVISPWFQPLLVLNETILSSNYTKRILRIFISLHLIALNINIKRNKSLFIYVFFFIIPKILMLLCLIIDCFYYHQLNLIYSCIFVISIPLFLRYLLYASKKLKEIDILLLEKHFIIQILSEDQVHKPEDRDSEGHLKPGIQTFFMRPSEITYDSFGDEEFGGEKSEYKYLLISRFIGYQADALFLDDKPFEYQILFHEERLDIIVLSSGTKKHIISKEECEKLLSFHIKNNIWADEISSAQRYYAKMFKKIEIILNLLFITCWSYILIKSIHTLPQDALLYLIPKYENPFL